MKRTILILVLVLSLIYLNHRKESFDGLGSFESDDALMIIVYSDGLYYLNIKNYETDKFDVYRISMDIIKNFYK